MTICHRRSAFFQRRRSKGMLTDALVEEHVISKRKFSCGEKNNGTGKSL